ncbi:folate-binding protein YgfZ [Aestuariibius sp. HNIBRBA575]|uniref:CAF17-like 4Fe-4S cluster assembly/insertion protein YgfZ n=1 Tax=Aestuariibius sp. HNIBRBA575 TaxID=3233343 RepID=UPI0034A21179
MNNRVILALTGADRHDFLDGLVTNVVPTNQDGLRYAALLTPQGKFIADFFLLETGSQLLIDVDASAAPGLFQRLNMYRLRADVQIAETDLIVSRGIDTPPADALPDPRHSALGWRHYGEVDQSQDVDWDAIHVAHVIPQTGIELGPDSYILEAGFERLNGVDFKKGCFVGQEIVARMKHKTELRKGLVPVHVDGVAETGAEITVNGKHVGTLHTRSGDVAIAYLRLDRAKEGMVAGQATLSISAAS